MRFVFLCLLFPLVGFTQTFTKLETDRYKQEARRVTIIRDNWGIPHVYGKTDADAVFGIMYAQCEDDFVRMERNYLQVMGRLAEVDGERGVYNDLQLQLIEDTAAAIRDYKESPAPFKKLLDAFADGVNYYLALHPHVKPAVLKRFEPWYALMFTDGSIGATQTGGLTTRDMRELYPLNVNASAMLRGGVEDPAASITGSNGFAIGPSKTASKNAILYINPHVTFYFRPEVQMVSEEGLQAYGAVTWGQFFVYQGFNEHCGWMHTSSIADVSDLYEEKIVKRGDSVFYQYDNAWKPVRTKKLVIRYKKGDGLVELPVTAYYTHHGPVVGSRNGKWLSLKENNRSLNALRQSWLRTKAHGFAEFEKTMQLLSNNSNNTVFADDKGNIAYWHGNFMPRRDPSLNWQQPVDGSTSATEWKGLHPLNETVHIYNPASGWIQNCNSTPFTASGASSPRKGDYPAYMAPDAENFRAVNAARVLSAGSGFTLDKTIAAGYDHTLAAFDVLLPPLFKAYEQHGNDSLKQELKEPVDLLQGWDKKSGVASVPTALAIEWAYRVYPQLPRRGFDELQASMEKVPGDNLLLALKEVLADLKNKYGSWKTPWGQINRYQRLTGGLDEKFDDNQPSLPSGLASSTWGSLPAFEGVRFPGTKLRYGTRGNSFIAAIEFGKKVTAKSILTGGERSDPRSKHFTDQAAMYLEGSFKDVLFYKEDVLKHVEMTYHPGEDVIAN
ncbi:MAG: penicillin acylase family protein [Williamsia sp.]|nr:penicillin acylase family protein [Williamsia sp.]